ncbi:histidine kinase N-terminal 7TM domain-containing protein [[Eubacterium] cellulosolvens]
MLSSILLATSIVSMIGFIINIIVLLLVLSRGKKKYHYLFASLLFIAACWDLGIFLITVRNDRPNEIIQYAIYIMGVPFTLFPALIFHFTTAYLSHPRMKTTIALYVYGIIALILTSIGIYSQINGIYNYAWGNIHRFKFDLPVLSWIIVYHLSIWISCWLLFQARKRESTTLIRRHIGYIIMGFVIFSVAQIKLLVTFGVNIAFTLLLGMVLVDSFGALIGIAIVKDRLFDITVFVKKGIVYSVLAALIIFIFDFSQHIIAKYLGDILAGHSIYIHFAIIAIVVGLFMPLKPKIEHVISNVFAKKKIKF